MIPMTFDEVIAILTLLTFVVLGLLITIWWLNEN